MAYLFSVMMLFPQQDDGETILAFLIGACFCLVSTALLVVFLAGFWKTFVKAGQPGWAAIIPIYNIYVMLQIIGRPGWWLILFFIPLVNIVVWVVVSMDVAKSFGKDPIVFGIILIWLLGGLGFLIIGFGDAKYKGPVGLA